jgi:beta-lactamase class A
MRYIIVSALLAGIAFLITGLAWQQLHTEPQTVKAVTKTEDKAAARLKAEEAKIQQESLQLQALLTSFQQQYPGQISLVVTNLSNGASASASADEQMVSASLYKLYVAFGIYQLIDDGTLTADDWVGTAGATVNQCLDVMITVSDNLCGWALGDLVGWQKLDATLATLDLSSTKTDNYTASGDLSGDKITTARDTALFMQLLFKGTLLSKTSTDNFIALLKANEINTWLPAGLPEGTIIAHKTGSLYDYIHDAGIVYANNGAYLVVMMTRGWEQPAVQTPPIFTDLSRQLWEFFNSPHHS